MAQVIDIQKPAIAWDLDGSVNNLSGFMIENGTKFFGREPQDIHHYELEDMFDCSKLRRQMFWAQNIIPYCRDYAPREDAHDVINELYYEGYPMCMPTARVFVEHDNFLGKLFRKYIYEWLDAYGIPMDHDKIYFCSEKNSARDKLYYAILNRVEYFFEDKPINIEILNMLNKLTVLVPKSPYNEHMRGDNIVLIDTLTEGLNYIKNDSVLRLERMRGSNGSYRTK